MTRAEETSGYRPRLADERLRRLLETFPAVLLNGPRAAGKTTTARQLVAAEVRLDKPAQAAAFRADPDAALKGRPEPLLLDEWQEVPGVLGAVKRATDDDPRPGRFLLTGSVRSDLENQVWPGTGRLQRTRMHGFTELEVRGGATPERVSLLDTLIAADPSRISVPSERPDLTDYVRLALRGGFPAIALTELSDDMRDTWVDSYLDQLLTRDVHSLDTDRDHRKLKRYFQALAASSAGQPEHKTIYDAAGIDKKTARLYDALLEGLFITDAVPGWDTNLLDRVTQTPKRYVTDPALMASALGATTDSVLANGDLLGRLIDTFVMSQLRPEVALRGTRAQVFHIRTKAGREEVDIVVELPGSTIVAFEVKSTASPSDRDAKHLRWLRDRAGAQFLAGAVMHTGPETFEMDDRIFAIPICAFWG